MVSKTKSVKILIIEDKKLLCQLYGSALRKAAPNREVVLAYSGEEGVACALQNRPDVIILDLILPDIPGFEVARQLRDAAILPSVPLIITTGQGEDARQFADSLNATLLPKPFQVAELIVAVDKALAGSSP